MTTAKRCSIKNMILNSKTSKAVAVLSTYRVILGAEIFNKKQILN
jgi:hypothetical protein